MITVKCFEDITLYHYAIVEAGTQSDVLYMKVFVHNTIFNYYQYANTVIITDSIIDLKHIHSVIPLTNHLNLLEQSLKTLEFFTNIHGIQNSSTYPNIHIEFIDIRRVLKLKQLFEKNNNLLNYYTNSNYNYD